MKRNLPPWLWAVAAVVGVFGIGVVDWLTGYELSFFVFYFAPVALGAWFLGRGAAVALAVLSAFVWFEANRLAGQAFSSAFVTVWDTMVRLVAYLLIGWSAATIRHLLERERETADTLRRSLAEIRVLEGILPVCAQCKSIRDKQGVWHRMEVYIEENTQSQFSHGFCPDCAREIMKKAGLVGKALKA